LLLTGCNVLGPFPGDRSRPIEPGMYEGLVFESFECQSGGEASALLYTGIATPPSVTEPRPGARVRAAVIGESASVALRDRYQVRYRSALSGIDDTNWYCIPRKRICYSKVLFDDWGGKYKEGDAIKADSGQVFDLGVHTIATAIEETYNAQCR